MTVRLFSMIYIYSLENGTAIEKKVTDLTLAEFLSYGPQRQPGRTCKSLLRKTENGEFLDWKVQQDDCFCTLKDAFCEVDSSLGFNVELKFDDDFIYEEKVLVRVLEQILKVVFKYAKQRSIIFSSFHPDAASLMRMLQNIYPVFFLTDGGSHIYRDVRRNSLDEALRLCMENRLQGIVSEVSAVFRNPEAISKIKQSNLSLLTYGQLNNLPEPVRMQYLMGVDGVIVDLVSKIAEEVSGFVNKSAETKEERTMVVSTERPTYLQQILSRSLEAHA